MRNHRRPRAALLAMSLLLAVTGLVAGQSPALAVEGSWEATGSLNVPRLQLTATLLPNGRVLVAGGRNFAFTLAYNSAELYDPITETFTLTGSMADARWSHTATLLPNGKVLVAGGFTNPSTNANAQPVLASAELYDPATGTWTPTGSMSTRRALHVAQLLPNGKVLVAGGRTCDQPPPTACGSTFTTNTAEIYDPATGVWTPTANMINARTTTSAAPLPNGTVIVPAGFPSGQITSEVYNPATGTWTAAGNLHTFRARQGAMVLPDGDVLVAAGSTGPSPNLTSETYDLATNTWTVAGNVAMLRFNYFYAELPNGDVLIAGGGGAASAATTAEVYDPATRTWSSAGTLANAHGSGSSNGNSTRAVVLSASPTSFVFDPRVCGTNCGKVLVVGDNPTGAADLYTPAAVSLSACTTTVTGASGSITVPSGSVTCVTNAYVDGSVTVRPGGALVMTNSVVSGGVQSTGAAAVRICGSRITGQTRGRSLSVTNSFGPVVVGDGTQACARNDLFGPVYFDANYSVELDNNRVGGGVSTTWTAGGTPSAVIAANQISGGLACSDNTPPPTNDGRPNAVSGARSGQCGAAGF